MRHTWPPPPPPKIKANEMRVEYVKRIQRRVKIKGKKYDAAQHTSVCFVLKKAVTAAGLSCVIVQPDAALS